MPLLWMCEEASEFGLMLNVPNIDIAYKSLHGPDIKKFRDRLYWLAEVLPFRRLRYGDYNMHTSQ
jgi:hypothetical protein